MFYLDASPGPTQLIVAGVAEVQADYDLLPCISNLLTKLNGARQGLRLLVARPDTEKQGVSRQRGTGSATPVGIAAL